MSNTEFIFNAPTALATATATTVKAVAETIDTELVTEFKVGRTNYSTRAINTRIVEFDGGRVRFQMTMEVTRTTARSTKTFRASVSVDNYEGLGSEPEDIRVGTLFNEAGNQVYAAQFDGYRAAAVAHAVQVVETALEAVGDTLDQEPDTDTDRREVERATAAYVSRVATTNRDTFREALEAYEAGDVLAFIETGVLWIPMIRDCFLAREILDKQEGSFWLRVGETYKQWAPAAAAFYWVAEEGSPEAERLLAPAAEYADTHTGKIAGVSLLELIRSTLQAWGPAGVQGSLQAIQEGAAIALQAQTLGDLYADNKERG